MTGGIIFIIGSLGLFAFALLRFFEVKKGFKFLGEKREKADAVVSDVYKSLVLGEIPQEYRMFFISLFRNSLHKVIVFMARILRAIERPLSRMGHRVRSSDLSKVEKAPSDYLRTITPQKMMEKSEGDKPSEIEENSV